MNIKGLSWVVGVTFLFLLAGTTMAQKGQTHASAPVHSHKAHHGGTVKSVGDYHIELVEDRGKYVVYLLDMHEHSIPLRGVSGMAILRDNDRTLGSQNLIPVANTHFELPVQGLTPTAIIINLNIKGQSLIAKFDKNQATALNYFCPQKCAGSESSLPGTCPKCGTALIDRRLVAK
ncbi:heavy metal-binding domain-containing protein [Adhaeribacter aquaticus]|uniref:heavy metal-binding domain-containing protein n=1 Tax=Adhaeribacter aquaticus TaxID=299567 RepID=UPI0003FE6417|nr:heavy metal-binding domain-containing protein [Adhaeribacter aquaticus]